jgi:hypothetical protein
MTKRPWTKSQTIGVWLGFVGLMLMLTGIMLEVRALTIAGFFVLDAGLVVIIIGAWLKLRRPARVARKRLKL